MTIYKLAKRIFPVANEELESFSDLSPIQFIMAFSRWKKVNTVTVDVAKQFFELYMQAKEREQREQMEQTEQTCEDM